MAHKKECEQCGAAFTSRVSTARYCSGKCRARVLSERLGRHVYVGPKLATATVGAVSELMVGADLMRRGYAVFRALSASCFCDLIAFKDGQSFNVEVRTCYNYVSTLEEVKFHYPKKLHGEGVHWFGLYERNTGQVFYKDAKTHADVEV